MNAGTCAGAVMTDVEASYLLGIGDPNGARAHTEIMYLLVCFLVFYRR